MKIHYTIQKYNDQTQVVIGEQIGAYFATTPDKKRGWLLTHIKTGKLVTTAGFTSKQDLEVLVNLIEYVFGEDIENIENAFEHATGMRKTLVNMLKATYKTDRILTQHDVRYISLKVGGYE